MKIMPIETIYNGFRFRSRAEARWAVFFDTCGIKYQYEPEGVRLSDETLYLPDFYLPDSDTWFEVKGVLDATDKHKVEQLIADTSKPAVIGYSDLTFEACDAWDGEFCLASRNASALCRCSRCGNLWFMGWAGYYGCRCCGEYDGDHHIISHLSGPADEYDLRLADGTIRQAYYKARQARFEHGEKPK
jgi:hypothetical protein